MTSNKMDDDLKSDHLFLLVGTNPLPDWVAAKLLLRDGGQLYLVHSDTTFRVAERLSTFATNSVNKFQQPIFVSVNDEHDGESVRQAIRNQLQTIKSGSIGLNYTGGTKVMAVHGYQAMMEELGLGKAVFSYLEAANCLLRVEPFYSRSGLTEKVGLAVPLKLEELFALHGDYKYKQDIKHDFRGAAVGPLLARLHSSEEGRKSWRSFCDSRLKYNSKTNPPPRGFRFGEFRAENELEREMLSLSSGDRQIAMLLDEIAKELVPGGAQKNKTLKEIVQSHSSMPPAKDFSTAAELARWMDGMWLEDYTLQEISALKESCDLWDCGRTIEVKKPVRFEVDVAAMRGYQLHFISCYTGSDTQRSRLKLFEIYTHARHVGGEAARAALVCCADSPGYIQQQVGDLWDLKDQVRVFGRDDLKDLGKSLKDWFETGAR